MPSIRNWEDLMDDELDYLYEDRKPKKKTKIRDEFTDNSEKKKKKSFKNKAVSKVDLWDEYLEEKETEDFSSLITIKPKKPSFDRKNDKKVDDRQQKGQKNDERIKPFVKKEAKEPQKATEKPIEKKKIAMGPNTHTIKGSEIDFDGVVDIQKVQNSYNGKETFGIKFMFKSKNGAFRVVWFNQNSRERDSVYNTEFAFWKKLKNGS